MSSRAVSRAQTPRRACVKRVTPTYLVPRALPSLGDGKWVKRPGNEVDLRTCNLASLAKGLGSRCTYSSWLDTETVLKLKTQPNVKSDTGLPVNRLQSRCKTSGFPYCKFALPCFKSVRYLQHNLLPPNRDRVIKENYSRLKCCNDEVPCKNGIFLFFKINIDLHKVHIHWVLCWRTRSECFETVVYADKRLKSLCATDVTKRSENWFWFDWLWS